MSKLERHSHISDMQHLLRSVKRTFSKRLMGYVGAPVTPELKQHIADCVKEHFDWLAEKHFVAQNTSVTVTPSHDGTKVNVRVVVQPRSHADPVVTLHV